VSRAVTAFFLAATLEVLAAPSSFAKPVEERRPVDADVVVTVKNVNGSVTVEGWSKKELEVTGTITGDVEEVLVDGTSKRMRVEARFPENQRHSSGSANLDIKVPVGAGLRIDVVNATITISKVSGEANLAAVNGDISVTDPLARLSAQTVNGDITIESKCDQVEAETVGGKIVLNGVSGDVTAGSVGGSIQVTAGEIERAKLSTVSGPVDLSATLGANATVHVECHSGDVTLQLPADVSAEFEAETFSGDIDNAFGPSAPKRGHSPGRTLNFTAGGGDAQVSVSTFSGDIKLLKK
jgi:DUF4097 and DUF4098 domain-containing protein YvlB